MKINWRVNIHGISEKYVYVHNNKYDPFPWSWSHSYGFKVNDYFK